MQTTWILIGDGSHARLFFADDASQPWRLVRRIDREHSREKTNQGHEDRGEHAFARQLVAELETGRQEGAFHRLVLVATPKLLGQLRTALPHPLAACVVASMDVDYTHMSDHDLAKQVVIDGPAPG